MASVLEVVFTFLYVYGCALLYGLLVGASLAFRQLFSPTKCIFTVKKREVPPQCLQDEALGRHGYVTVKGMKFHYVEKGDPSKLLMLFVHGFPEFWYSWRHQMKEFSKDYWTVAIDMRGYGDSAKPTSVSDYRLELLVDDIKGIVTELGRKKFILVAHDWGAIVSWTFVDKYPEMIEKYVMMNGPHPKVFAIMMMTRSQASKSWYMFFYLVPLLPELFLQTNDFRIFKTIFSSNNKSNPNVSKDDIEAFKYTFYKSGFTLPINYYRAAIHRRAIQGYSSKNYNMILPGGAARPPGLYVFGADDLYIDIANVEKHHKYFEPIETVIIPDANHFVQQDNPKAVNDAMRSFLSK